MAHRTSCCLGLMLLLTWLGPCVLADDLTPFVLPFDDASPGVTNLSFLNAGGPPKNSLTTDKEGHLYCDGQRLRLLGVNCVAQGNAPEKNLAPLIAARMVKFGINAVRLHHIDAPWWENGLLQYERKTTRKWNEQTLDRIDFFIHQLRQRGIYFDLSLLASRKFLAGDGVETEIEAMEWNDQHTLAMFDPRLIHLQQEYAAQWLTHRNPYTQLFYVDDPALAIVEISNEIGLISGFAQGRLDRWPAMSIAPLQKEWNTWLSKRYKSTSDLRQAWQMRLQPLGKPMLDNGDFSREQQGWSLSENKNVQTTMTVETASAQNADATDEPKRWLKIQAAANERTWNIALQSAAVPVRAGNLYTVTFKVRSEGQAALLPTFYATAPSSMILATGQVAQLTSQWQSVQIVWIPLLDASQACVKFNLSARQPITLFLADVQISPGGCVGFTSEEKLENASILVPTLILSRSYSQEFRKDWLEFLYALESRYWLTMRDFLKHDLKYRGLIIGTITGTSLPSIQSQMDAIDSHAYWQHPLFPKKPWDPQQWNVGNSSMATNMPGALGSVMGESVSGKPRFVTEYNHPAPNPHAAEGPLLLAAYAAYHDLDGMFFYCYGDQWNSRKISGFFDISQHPTQMANLTLASALYRRADVRPGKPILQIGFNAQRELSLLSKEWRSWSMFNVERLGIPTRVMLLGTTPMRLINDDLSNNKPLAVNLQGLTQFRSDTNQLLWENSQARHGYVLVDTPRTKIVVGQTDHRELDLGSIHVQFSSTIQQWCTLGITQIQGNELLHPGRAMLVVTGYVENTNMGWTDENKISVGSNWGDAPSLVEVVPLNMTLPIPAARVEAFALDERGQRAHAIAVEAIGQRSLIKLGPPAKTIWYELVFKPEK